MDLTRCVSAGAKLPAPGLLIMVCSLENSQDVSLFIQGMAMTNVVVCPSLGSKHGTIAAVSCGCGDGATGFFSALARSFNRL